VAAEVMVAYDGPQVLAAVPAFQPRVVLLDIGMPGMDGYAVARERRGRPDGARPTLVALTGWGQEDGKARASAAGFDHHLVKPADIEALRAVPQAAAA